MSTSPTKSPKLVEVRTTKSPIPGEKVDPKSGESHEEKGTGADVREGGTSPKLMEVRTTKSPIPGEKIDPKSWRKSRREGNGAGAGVREGKTQVKRVSANSTKKSRVGLVQDDRKSNPGDGEIQWS